MSWNKIEKGKLHMAKFEGAFAKLEVDGGTVYAGLDDDIVIITKQSSPSTEMTSAMPAHPSGGVDVEFMAILQQSLIENQAAEPDPGGEPDPVDGKDPADDKKE